MSPAERNCRRAEEERFGDKAVIPWMDLARACGQISVEVEPETHVTLPEERFLPEQRFPAEMPVEAQVA